MSSNVRDLALVLERDLIRDIALASKIANDPDNTRNIVQILNHDLINIRDIADDIVRNQIFTVARELAHFIIGDFAHVCIIVDDLVRKLANDFILAVNCDLAHDIANDIANDTVCDRILADACNLANARGLARNLACNLVNARILVSDYGGLQ